MKTIKISILILFLGISCCCKSQVVPNNATLQNDIDSQIVNTWVAEGDSNAKLVFNTNNLMKEYYQEQLVATYNYSITHQCGNEHDTDTWFLKLTDSQDSSQDCYELYGANVENNGTLSMRDMTTGKVFVYNIK